MAAQTALSCLQARLVGGYRLVFTPGRIQAHFPDLPEPKFLSDIPIDFAIADAASHYHVPLLLSPFGYRPIAAAAEKGRSWMRN